MKTALVTGASRGLGLETCIQLADKGLHVFLGTRRADQALENLRSYDGRGKIELFEMDFEDRQLETRLRETFSARPISVLVNNAGVFPGGFTSDDFTTAPALLREAFDVNVLSAFRLCQALIPSMIEKRYGRVVNVSSGMGQLSEMESGYAAYRISKTAMNAVTRIFSGHGRNANVLVNSVCPGWVRTEMGGPSAPRSVETGAQGIVWAATLPDDGPTGGFFRDGQPLAW